MPKLSLAKLERHLYSAADRLRQEGLDAATYKDYIFGMLFLKRCSDVFDGEHETIVGRKIEQGVAKEAAETQYGGNPDFYDGFFVPERARWTYLQSKLSDASEPFGSAAVLIMARTELVEPTQSGNVGRDKATGRSRLSLCRKRFAYSGLHLRPQQVKMRIAVGSVLDKALGALSEYNESLEHVLEHIQFMRMQSNKRTPMTPARISSATLIATDCATKTSSSPTCSPAVSACRRGSR
jgi:hypothetical protein